MSVLRAIVSRNVEVPVASAETSAVLVGLTIMTVALLGGATPSQAQNRFALAQVEVVVFVGGTNMVHLQKAGYLEAMLTQAFAAARPRFRDLSWEADTVFRQGSVIERWRNEGFGTLDEQLKRVGATVVIAQFGQFESMAGSKDASLSNTSMPILNCLSFLPSPARVFSTM